MLQVGQFWRHFFTHLSHFVIACALFASPKQASAMPARPRPNFFSAARRVTDWARLFVSSSNLLFILFLSFRLFAIPGSFAHEGWVFLTHRLVGARHNDAERSAPLLEW